MKAIIFAIVALGITGCMTTKSINPKHAGDPDYTPDGWVKRPYEYIFKTDGSQKAKECVFECKKQETQCKQLAATKDQTSQMNTNPQSKWIVSDALDSIKEYDDHLCEQNNIECVKTICNGSVAEKHYLY